MKKVDKFIEILSAIGMGALVLACVWQVASRYILGKPSTWTEELMRYGLIWVTMLVAPYAYGKKKQLVIGIFVKKMPEKFQYIIQGLVSIVMILFSIFIMIIGGFRAAKNAVGQISSSLQIPMQFLYYSLIISGILMVVYSLIMLKEDVKNVFKERKEKLDEVRRCV